MATVTRTGPSVGSGLRKSRLRLQLDRTDNATFCTVRFRVWVETSNSESWSISTTVYGGWPDTGKTTTSINHTGGYSWSSSRNQTLVYDKSENYTRQYGSTGEAAGSAIVTGIGSGQSPVEATGDDGISISIPSRSYEVPYVPTGLTRVRNSDPRHNISWGADWSAARPLEKFRIQRHDGLRDPNWRTVTVVGGSVRAWADMSTRDNTRYRWRIRAENSAGSSDWAYSEYISTTPLKGVAPEVRHQGGDNLVTVTRGVNNMAVRGVIQHQSAAVGGGWSSWSTIHTTSDIGAQNATVTYRHEDVDNTRRHRYRMLYENVTDSPTLQSEWSDASAVIELLAAPNAPTGVSPNGETLDSAKDWTVSWQHNSVDGTDQTRREVRTRIEGASWSIAGLDTDAKSVVFGPDRLQGGKTTEIQVRTWGEFPDPSPWSAIATVYSSDRPQATVTHPEESQVLDGSTVTAGWGYFDTESTGQAQWQATLYDGFDNPLEFRAGAGDTSAVTFREQLEDDTTYQVGIMVRDGDRLWSDEVKTTFSTEFALPPTPTFTAAFATESGAVVIDTTVPDSVGAQVEADHLQVWRAIGTGRELLVGDQIPPGSAFTDYLPHLVQPNFYRVVSVSALPSVASTDVITVQVEESQRQGWVYFNAGTGFERVIRLRANADVQVTQGREKAMRTFAGRRDPVEFSGEHESWEASLSVKLAPSEPGHATRDDLARVVQLPAPICYRDITAPAGHREFVSLGDFDHSQSGVVSSGSLSFTRVEDPEIKHTDGALSAGQLPGVGGGSGEEE